MQINKVKDIGWVRNYLNYWIGCILWFCTLSLLASIFLANQSAVILDC